MSWTTPGQGYLKMWNEAGDLEAVKKKAEERAHILIGLSVSVENLDKVIKIIRSSKNPDDAKKSLLNNKWKINKSLKLINLIENKKKKNLY